ncbi:MAG: prepilin peptidase [Ruminococcus sp.]|nr:prepilin peptidase [Ruminococcus sp.]
MDIITVYYIVMYVFVFLFGICIGSFLNVCIYRLPINESLTKKNSHCMTCGTPIRKRDLIPIVSWCCLRGKCHACGARISPRYTVVEALNGVLYLVVFMLNDIVSPVRLLHAALVSLMFSALIVVFFMDWDTQLINLYVVLFIAIVAIPEMLFCERATGVDIRSHIIGAFVVSIPLLILSKASHEKAMGMGDVYLMAAGGLFLGIQGVLIAMLIALLSGSVCGIIIKYATSSSKFAFGPYLSIGIAIAALWGGQLGDLYMRLTGLEEILNESAEMAMLLM